ncbi:MAG: hypothetical protein ACW99F_04345 [Candidatus Hodarchaeales archaeon]|jgi:hypothetical protein
MNELLHGFFFVCFWVFVFKETTFLEHWIFRREDWYEQLEKKRPFLAALLDCPLCFGFWISIIAWGILGGSFFNIFVWDLCSFWMYKVYIRLIYNE